ncbi:MAG: segregation/condensation protein A [bacterium]|nr:segregation/condensation protein A [bacterium]
MPEARYELKLEQFTGPMDKLLELIEEQKLEITEISLAKVTADFLAYTKTLLNVERGILADFLVVAAKLLLIKSKALLPNIELTLEEKGDIRDLEGRLQLYKEFKAGASELEKLWAKRTPIYSRPLFMNRPAVFYPPADLTISWIVKALDQLARTLKEAMPEAQSIRRAIITLEEKIAELGRRITAGMSESFKNIAGNRSREEIIVLFLALLHLAKDRLLRIDQHDHFADIIITKLERASADETPAGTPA